MATVIGTHSSVYWGSGSTTPVRVQETKNVAIDLGGDFAEDTVHGDVNRSYQPTFTDFSVSVTGLWNTAVTLAQGTDLVTAANAKSSGRFSIYIGDASHYFYGSGYVSIDSITTPFDDFATLDWSIRSSGQVGNYGV